MKKIGISANAKDLGSMVSVGFGRSPYICIVEWDEAAKKIGNYHFIQNNGNGIDLAQDSASEGIEAMVTGQFIGHMPFSILQGSNVKLYDGQGKKVEEAVTDYFANKLTAVTTPATMSGGYGGGQVGRGLGGGRGRGPCGRGQGRGQGGRGRP